MVYGGWLEEKLMEGSKSTDQLGETVRRSPCPRSRTRPSP